MKKVLVVDDSFNVRQQVGLALTNAGFEVVEAIDGLDGVAKVESIPDLSAVVLDINMPRMGGIEMLTTIRKNGKNASLPVIILTTEGQPDLINQARSAGAKGWMVKPFKAERLVEAIRKCAGG